GPRSRLHDVHHFRLSLHSSGHRDRTSASTADHVGRKVPVGLQRITNHLEEVLSLCLRVQLPFVVLLPQRRIVHRDHRLQRGGGLLAIAFWVKPGGLRSRGGGLVVIRSERCGCIPPLIVV